MIKIDGIKEINKKLMSLDRDLAPTLVKDVTKDAYKNIRKRAEKHFDTGTMENNIFFKVSKKSLEGVVGIGDEGMMVQSKGVPLNYALFVLYGTKAHIIKHKDKKSLRWSSVNKFYFAKSVNHPGYKGDNILHDGLQDTLNNIDSIIARIKDE